MFEKKRGTRFLASVMALVMLLSLAPVGALATEDEDSQENPAVSLPADKADQKPVVTEETNTANTNEETTPPPANEGIAVLPANNSNTPVALPETPVIVKPAEVLDKGFGVKPNTSNNSIQTYDYGQATISSISIKETEREECDVYYAETLTKVHQRTSTDTDLNEFQKNGQITYSDSDNLVKYGVVFFVKPHNGYALEKVTASSSASIYKSIVDNDTIRNTEFWTTTSQVANLKSAGFTEEQIVSLIEKAKDNGCVAAFIFTRNGSTSPITTNLQFRTQKLPTFEKNITKVESQGNTYTGNQLENVKVRVGDVITYSFKVTFYPGENKITYNNIVVTDERLEGEDSKISFTDESSSTTRTQTQERTYTVKAQDIATGTLTNTATLTYKYKAPYNMGDVTSEATAEAKIATVSAVSYAYTGTVPAGAPDVNAGAYSPTHYAENTTVNIAATPSLEGYQFIGWTAPDGVTVNNGTFTMPDKSITFTGEWKANKHKVTYKDETETISGLSQDNVDYGTTVTVPSYSKEGCTLTGWKSDADNNTYSPNQTFTMPDKDVTLTAQWTETNPAPDPDPDPTPGPSTPVPAMFFINLGGKDASNPNGIGTFTKEIKIPNALNKTTFEDHLDDSMGSNRGFIFNIEGVKKVQGCEGNKLLIQEPNTTAINQKIIAEGKNNMTVGDATGREVVWYHVSSCGDGYHVDGYVKGVPITLTYHENFGTSDAQTVINKNNSGTTLNSGDKVTIQTYDQVFTNEATKHQGWTFEGWFTANGQEYKQEETTLIDSVDLYAKWEKNYTVNFIGNGGVWDSSVSGYTMTTEDGKNIKATKPITVTPTTESTATVSKIETAPTKGGYDFLGWSKTIGGPIITESEWATMKPGETTTIDFYANWKTKQDPTPDTVNYTINKHFKDNKGKTKDVNGTPTPGTKNVTLGNLITKHAVNQTDGENKYVYVPDETTFKMGGQKVTSNTQLTREATIDLYYYLDNWKDADNTTDKDSETGGDGIPDCYQVLVKYQSGDLSKGKIADTARTQEVLTIKDATGNPTNTGTVQASGSTAEATGSRNYFSNWTDTIGKQVDTYATLGQQTIKNAEGGETYTFTANFYHRSSSGSSRPSTPTVTIPDDVPTGLNGKDHYAYIIGYGNNDVRPQNNITRAEVATIFFRLLTDETRTANMTKSNGYNDVKDGDWFCCAVSTLSKMGIIKGYEDGSFKPNDPISRAEFAAIAARFDPDGDKTPATFADVTSHWAKDEISIAANHGWIKGYEDGSFKPDQKITRAETMTLVNRVLNRLPETKDDLHKDMKTWVDNMDETAWYYLAVQEATNSHYFKNKTGTKFEQWTDLRDTRDWSELEK